MLPLLLTLGCRPEPTPRPVQPEVAAEALQAEGRVILVTIDGVRWQEATDPGLLPSLSDWALFGDRRLGSRVETSSLKPLSLPGYHALMAGHTTPCEHNRCGRIDVETLPESFFRIDPLRRLDLVLTPAAQEPGLAERLALRWPELESHLG